MASAAGEADERTQIRGEFEELQRQYKHMEAMKKAYADESLGIIKKQKELIERLQGENGSLKAELELENRFAQKKAAKDSQLSALHDQIDSYTVRSEVEKKNIATLSSNIETVKAKIEALRAAVGGSRAAEENNRTQNKQTKILENRLDKALVKFNEVLAENKTLRQEIDDLRQERVVFDGIYRRMEGELEGAKKGMASIIEESNQAYEVRDAATVQLMDLQAAMAREAEEFDAELRTLDSKIEAEDQAARAMEDSHRGGMSIAEEVALKERARSGERDLARARAAMVQASERAAAFEQALQRIREATGTDSVEALVASFIKGEEANFSLFNYIAEQSTEMERLEEAIAAMRSDADAASSASGSRAHSSQGVLKGLEAKLGAARAAVGKFEERCGTAQAAVEAVCTTVGRVYRRLECAERGMGELLVGEAVTETNSMAFLSVVEQRSAELMEAFMAAKAVEDGIAVPVFASRPGSAQSGQLGSGGFLLTGLPDSPPGARHAASSGALASSPGSRAILGSATEVSASASLRVDPSERRAAASAVASMLGPGPATGKSPLKGASAFRVEAPRLGAAGWDDSDSDGEARPLTTAELRSGASRVQRRK